MTLSELKLEAKKNVHHLIMTNSWNIPTYGSAYEKLIHEAELELFWNQFCYTTNDLQKQIKELEHKLFKVSSKVE